MNYEVLINKDNLLNKEYIPDDLVICDNNENNFHNFVDSSLKPMVIKTVFDEFNLFKEHAKQYGYNFIIDSGYRSYEYQQKIFDYNVKEKGLEHANKYVAIPGSSEHQSGLAIDIAIIKNNIYQETMSDEEYLFLKNNLYKYGFILRYPIGKEDITGYNYEPWHYRYVGRKLAKEINNLNITLEEYYNKKEA